jgi:hypothetical protein
MRQFCYIELHGCSMLRNAPEDGLVKSKQAVQRDYICNKRRCVDGDISYVHFYIYLFIIKMNKFS